MKYNDNKSPKKPQAPKPKPKPKPQSTLGVKVDQLKSIFGRKFSGK